MKDLLKNKSRDDDDNDDDDDGEIQNPPYAYRMWSLINGCRSGE